MVSPQVWSLPVVRALKVRPPETATGLGLSVVDPFRVVVDGDALVLSMQLPFTDRTDVELGRRNGELLVAVGAHRRAVVLPDSLRRREVSEARMTDGRLEVEFVEVAHGDIA